MRQKGTCMKKLTAILLCLCLLLPLAGCTGQNSAPADSDTATGKQTLTIYYVQTNNEVAYAETMQNLRGDFLKSHPDMLIDNVTFATNEELDEQLVNDLNRGTGPDVVLFSSKTTLDLQKLARSGAFFPLDPYLEKMRDEGTYDPEDILPAALAGCRMDEKQYLLPITYKSVNLYGIKPVFDDYGVDLGRTSWQDFLKALGAYTASTGRDMPAAIKRLVTDEYPDYEKTFTQTLLAASGLELVDYENKKVTVDEGTFRDLIEMCKVLYAAQTVDMNDPFYEEDFFAYFDTSSSQLLNYLWNTTLFTDYEREAAFYPLPTANDPSAYSVLASSFGVVTKDSKIPEIACDFLVRYVKHFAPTTPGLLPWQHTSVSADNVNGWIEQYKSGYLFNTREREYLSDEDANMILGLYHDIASYKLPNAKIAGMIDSEFLSYFEDNESYETCRENFLRKLSLYLEE